LGYREAGLRLRAASPLLPTTTHREKIPEVDLPLQKRLCLTAPTPRFKVGESSTAATAWHVEPALSRDDLYSFIDMVDATP
ncbi:hypothetical protein Tco_0634159, partial [Tanacetum coccineum]